MTGNRVEQLESRVRELEATLNGLTDELVDTKDRLETVERAVTDEGADTPGRRTDIVEGELLGEGERAAEVATDADGELSEETGNDTATGAETGGKAENETDTVESDTDGIIVA